MHLSSFLHAAIALEDIRAGKICYCWVHCCVATALNSCSCTTIYRHSAHPQRNGDSEPFCRCSKFSILLLLWIIILEIHWLEKYDCESTFYCVCSFSYHSSPCRPTVAMSPPLHIRDGTEPIESFSWRFRPVCDLFVSMRLPIGFSFFHTLSSIYGISCRETGEGIVDRYLYLIACARLRMTEEAAKKYLLE